MHNRYNIYYIIYQGFILYTRASLVAQMIKSLPAKQKTWVQFLGQEDPLEKGMAIHSNILAWRIPWIEEPGGLQSMWLQRVRHSWATNNFTLAILLIQHLLTHVYVYNFY